MTGRELWDQLAAYGPAGMFLLTLIDTAALPTAQAVDLLIVIQAAAAPGLALPLFACAVAGSTLGAMLVWAAGRKGGGWALRGALKPERMERIREQVQRYDAAALILPAALPIPLSPMKVVIFATGALGVGFWRAAIAFAFGRALRYGALVGLGMYFGDRAWPLIKQHGPAAVAVGVALAAIYFLFRSRRGRPARSSAAPGAGL
jgi:membrane protein YqaA with SNARE-associated domain